VPGSSCSRPTGIRVGLCRVVSDCVGSAVAETNLVSQSCVAWSVKNRQSTKEKGNGEEPNRANNSMLISRLQYLRAIRWCFAGLRKRIPASQPIEAISSVPPFSPEAPGFTRRGLVTAVGLVSAGIGWSLPAIAQDNITQGFLERSLTATTEANGYPAAAAAIITGSEIHVAAVGRRRIDRPEEVTVDDRFGLGSNTKAITATMLGTLVEDGQVRWDIPLAEALPGVAMRPEYEAATLRQVLTHRAGLQPWTSADAFERARDFYTGDLTTTRRVFAAAVLSEPPSSTPGTETRYSNADFVIAALIGELAGQENWEDLVTKRVFRPLGISARFAGSAVEPGQPWAHSRATGVLVPIDPSAAGPPVMQGAGGVALSIADYSVFVQAHLRGLRGQDTPMLRSSTIVELHRPGAGGPYALGWQVLEYAGALSSAHAGGNGDFYALAVIQPERDLAVVFLSNDGGDDVEPQASAFLKTLLAGPGPAPSGHPDA
jgi:CubicO group peptidase (beta-lactamase class C family)